MMAIRIMTSTLRKGNGLVSLVLESVDGGVVFVVGLMKLEGGDTSRSVV